MEGVQNWSQNEVKFEKDVDQDRSFESDLDHSKD